MASKMPQDDLGGIKVAGSGCNQTATVPSSISIETCKWSESGLALENEGLGEIPALGLENELQTTDGWVRISPFGDFPKEREVRQADGSVRYDRYIQRVDRPAAEELVNQFRTLLGSETLGKVKRFLGGTPIFRGHPDLPGAESRYPDKTRYGMFADLDAREDGLYGKAVLAEDSAGLLENDGLKYLSPFWLVRLTGQVEGGVPVCTPVKLISAGLTRSPNIKGGQPLANENTVMKELLQRLAVLLALANEATEDQITAEITKLKTQSGQVPALENELAPLRQKVTSLENDNAQAVNRLKSLRATHAGVLIGTALATGKITPAEKPAWETALANEAEFEAKAAEIQALQPKLKTQSAVGELGQRKVELLANESDRRARVQELVGEKFAKGLRYDAAFAVVMRENPELFKQMKQPGKN